MATSRKKVLAQLAQSVETYLQTYPEDKTRLEHLCNQLQQKDNLLNRGNMKGHVTASALILDEKAGRILLIRHKALNLWIQPGGHIDPDEMPNDAAIREAREEIGFRTLHLHDWHEQVKAIPLEIDTHVIPANALKAEGRHVHHDFRYLVQVAPNDRPNLNQNEINDMMWVSLDKVESISQHASWSKTIKRIQDIVS